MTNRLSALGIATLIVVLAACTPPQLPTTPTVTDVHGRVVGIAPLTGTSVQLELFDGQSTSPPLATAPVAVDGSFTLTLPKGADVTPYLQPVAAVLPNYRYPSSTCSGTVEMTPSTARQAAFATLDLTHDGNLSAILAAINRTDPKQNSDGSTTCTFANTVWFYVDASVRMSGMQTCTVGQKTNVSEMDLRLQAGWNVVSSVSTSVSFPDGRETTTEKLSRGTTAATIWDVVRMP